MVISSNRRYHLLLTIVISTILILGTIGRFDVSEWDEARNGAIAYEMYHNHDYVNYYYAGQPETWQVKPPLMTWAIVASYRLLGFNEFALRFPSAICTVLFFIIFFKLVERYEDSFKALLCCLILMSCKAILGWHIGITGDFDAMLVLWLTISAYCFILFLDSSQSKYIYLTALFTGLAFYTKGTAALLLVPGFICYAWLQQKLKWLFCDRHAWLAILLFLLLAGSWIAILMLWGKTSAPSIYGSKSTIETMLVHDTFRRLTSSNFEDPGNNSAWFFFSTLDVRLNLWNYLFYVSVITGLVVLFRHKQNLLAFIRRPANRLIIFSISSTLPLTILLSLAANKHDWYLAPAFGFIIIITVKGLMFLAKKWRPAYWITLGLILFTLTRHAIYLYTLPNELHKIFAKNFTLIQTRENIILTGQPHQHIYQYLLWQNKHIRVLPEMNDWSGYKNDILIIEKNKLTPTVLSKIIPVQYFDAYCLATIR